MNPNALVPVIEDVPFVLWESNTICRHLAGRDGRTDLLPTSPTQRARVEQWMDWQATELNNAWRYAFMALVRKSPAPADPRAIATGVALWNRHMRILDAQLDRTSAYVAGADLMLADVVLGLSTNRWWMTPMDRPELPAVQAYCERLSQRPAFLLHGGNGDAVRRCELNRRVCGRSEAADESRESEEGTGTRAARQFVNDCQNFARLPTQLTR